ncbi:hypothetical protein [Marinobacter sp. BGYM27]|uniref:hypothetical protein n=1 Tax=Marinobacter sp. BGYM27 TaxID=2975597 RepID=UPI0021A44740|nr:hypothetical protein [Marinobacter sp. BGYM27]MDG5499174.1 hypothetical protein [Marinobacter sp. BGYM27]
MAKRGSYPHPIIDAADDVGSEFEIRNVLVDPTQQDIEVTYEVLTDDPDLHRLLKSGDAMHSLRWSCSSTISTGEMEPNEYQRHQKGMRCRAFLDQDLVRGDVVAEVSVIAAKPISGHSWARQHSDYGTAAFDLQPGDILADGGRIRFRANKLYDPLDPPIGSCFQFVRSTSLHKGISVTFSGDETVDVQLPANTFDDFKMFSSRPDLQIGLVVLPALMETLSFIQNNRNSEPLDDKAWFIAIDRLVEERGGWAPSIFELAQKILEHPIDSAIRAGLTVEEED